MIATVGPNDVVARLGGDEFVVALINPPKDMAAISETMHRIRTAIAEPVELESRSFRITSSFGAAIYPNHGESVETLLANADAAMYRAKEVGRRRARRLHAGDQRQAARACDAAQRTAQVGAEPRFRPPLPAPGRFAQRQGVRGRSADPLAPRSARPGAAGQVHFAGRGIGLHRRDRPVGAPRSMPAEQSLAGRRPAADRHQRQRLSAPVPRGPHRRRRRRRAARERDGAEISRAGVDRKPDHAGRRSARSRR